ncbi:MAG TPA: ABC transporter substrate-binding protein [Xanthobacteraceae bacterium]
MLARSLKLVLPVLLMMSAEPARSAEPLKIRLAWAVVPAELSPILFVKPGIARHAGVTYTVEPIHFAAAPFMITALATGEVDIAPFSYSTIPNAVQNAGLADLRIIADEFQDGVEGYYTNQFMVRKDSSIQRVEDLKGKIIATNGAGSPVDIALRSMLLRHGLQEPRDVTMFEVQLPQMKAVLTERKADLIMSVLPFSVDRGLLDIARTLFTQREAVGTTQMIAWGTRSGFLQRNRDALVDFMEDVLRVTRWYTDPANHDEAVQIIAQFTKRPPELFAGWLFTRRDYYRDPDGLPNLDVLQQNINALRALGLAKADLDVRDHVDLTVAQEAARRIR